MLFKRRACDGISFALLIFGNIATIMALSGVNFTAGQNLDCTNDLDKLMSCDLEAQNCTEYNLTITSNDGFGEVICIFKQCGSGRCCCATEMTLVKRETHTATIWKGSENMGSKIISITDSFKPRVPTIISVKESNGNCQIRWKTNMEHNINERLMAYVTYYKKGDTEKVSISKKPTTIDELKYNEIFGDDLEPSTTYLVSLKSYINGSGRYSDSSEEWEFISPLSYDILLIAVIIILSIAAISISGVTYGCYVKIKAKWWDTVASCPNPKLLNMHPSEQEVLKPVLPVISSISVEPLLSDESKPWSKESLRDTSSESSQQSSGNQTNSSCLSYAVTEPVDVIAGVQDALGKAFANISPISPLTTNLLVDSGLLSPPSNLCGVRADDTTSGLCGFDNKTYSIFVPSIPHQSMANSSEVQTQAKMLCDSAYHPSDGDTYQPVPASPLVNLPPVVLSPMPTDMSYQQCNADPGGFSNTEDSSLSPISSDTNQTASCDSVSRVEAGCENSDKAVGGAEKLNVKIEAATYVGNPCYSCAPAGSSCFPSMDDDYQPFQNVAEQPHILFLEERSGEEEKDFNNYPEESVSKMPQATFNPVLPGFTNDLCFSELQRPFPFLISMPGITDSDYQSV